MAARDQVTGMERGARSRGESWEANLAIQSKDVAGRMSHRYATERVLVGGSGGRCGCNVVEMKEEEVNPRDAKQEERMQLGCRRGEDER